MLKFILSCLFFFLPAYFTNMTPSLLASLGVFNFLAKPIDFGKKFLGKPILGSHKTWRGIIFGLTIGILTVFLQRWLFERSTFVREVSFFNYQEINILPFALSLTFGAMLGDLFFAAIKRRLGLKPGTPFLPFDQINYVIGAAFFVTFFSGIDIPFKVWIILLLLTFILHITATQIGFALGLSKSRW
ncbi:CDP-archaeol synthase [bacterium]|nr:CDP-archaeol synthase [bacterium]